MANKRTKPEEVVIKLHQVEVLVGQGMLRTDAVRTISVAGKTCYRGRKNGASVRSPLVTPQVQASWATVRTRRAQYSTRSAKPRSSSRPVSAMTPSNGYTQRLELKPAGTWSRRPDGPTLKWDRSNRGAHSPDAPFGFGHPEVATQVRAGTGWRHRASSSGFMDQRVRSLVMAPLGRPISF